MDFQNYLSDIKKHCGYDEKKEHDKSLTCYSSYQRVSNNKPDMISRICVTKNENLEKMKAQIGEVIKCSTKIGDP